MRDTLLLIATWLCSASGFCLLAFAQDAHWALLRRRDRAPPSWLRALGWLLLGAAMLPALWRDGPAFGILLWIAMLTISAMTVTAMIVRLRRRP